jgi:hypothetical protein
VKRRVVAAMALAMGGILAIAGAATAAFQIVQMSATSGQPGDAVTVRVDTSTSLLMGGSELSQLFLIPRDAYEASPEPDRCDEIPGATVAGELLWHAATVEFQGIEYPGFVGTGSFTVPDGETGIYVVSGILHNPNTGCHVFALFGVGMDLPDTATGPPGPSGSIPRYVGVALLVGSLLLALHTRRDHTTRQ